MINLSPKLDIMTVLGRQLSHLVSSGLTLDEALARMRSVADESLLPDIDRLQRILRGEEEIRTTGPVSHSPLVAVGRLVNLVTRLGGEPLKLLGQLEATLSSLTQGYRAYWVGIGGFLLYAAALFLVAMIALLIFSIFVFPQFEALYNDFSADLPTLTRLVLNSMQLLQWPLFLAAASLLVALGVLALKIRDSMKRLSPLRGVMVKVPGLRRLCRTYNESLTLNFARMLHGTGVPADIAITEASKLTGTPMAVDSADPSSDTPPVSLKGGELTGILSFARRLEVLDRELDYLAGEAETRHTQSLAKVREEFTLIAQIFIAAVVALLVISMYLPIFKLGSLV